MLRDATVEVIDEIRHWRRTVRGRLTLLYGGLFIGSGVLLLALTYGFVRHGSSSIAVAPVGGARIPQNLVLPTPGSTFSIGSEQHSADLRQLLAGSVVALALMAVLSIVLGRLVAARVLSPLRAMTTATQEISEENLHRRLALKGPDDELKKLSDTIDGLLGRLQDAFDAQRRFVANASHELRTPLTVTRALLEMSLSDPHADVASLRSACTQVLQEGKQQEQLIDALLLLARSQRGLERREQIDLAAVVTRVLPAQESVAAQRGVQLEHSLSPASLSGDPLLIELLVTNLLENALFHNIPQGRALVSVERDGGQATLKVANTGPVIATGEVERLLRPFQRLAPERTGEHDGAGLGLSIVQAIADAHDAVLTINAQPFGGLMVEVRFPPPSPHPDHIEDRVVGSDAGREGEHPPSRAASILPQGTGQKGR
jgi:signal transduction histidine kinase